MSKQQICQGSHVLVIDDEPAVAKFIRELLLSRGCEVTVINNSKEAHQYFEENADAIDLVITDQTMPDMTGKELAQAMLAIRPDIVIFLITGYSEEINANGAKEIGIKEFLNKPLRSAELLDKVQSYL